MSPMKYRRYVPIQPVVVVPRKPISPSSRSCRTRRAVNRIPRTWKRTRGSTPKNGPRQQTEVGPISGMRTRAVRPRRSKSQPTTRSAESSSGLNISLVVPQSWENPYSALHRKPQEHDARAARRVHRQPIARLGPRHVHPAQFDSETSSSPPGAGCPPESKIGTVEVETPVLAEKLTGNIYIATPFDNKFDSLLGLYIVVKDPARGIIVKLAGPDRTEPRHRAAGHDVR